MSKKYIFLTIFGVLLASSAGAITNCDDQAKPAIGCPTGYSMMCSSGGGTYHWACGKEVNGAIIESPDTTQTSGVKQTLQTQVKVGGTKTDTGVEKVLPTVNKVQSSESGSR
jgi:hypothetical protein